MNHPASLSPDRPSSIADHAGPAVALLAAVILTAFAAMAVSQLASAPAEAEPVDEIPAPPVLPPAARSTVPDAAQIFAAHDGMPEFDAPTF